MLRIYSTLGSISALLMISMKDLCMSSQHSSKLGIKLMWGSFTCSFTSSTWDWTYFISSNTSSKSLPYWGTQKKRVKNLSTLTHNSKHQFYCLVQTLCMAKKYSRSCNESMTKLLSCSDMRTATQLNKSWTATGASCSLLGMKGNHRSTKVSKTDAHWGSHLKEDGQDEITSALLCD